MAATWLALLLLWPAAPLHAQTPTVTTFPSSADIGSVYPPNRVCGTNLDNANYLLFNGKYKAMLYEFGKGGAGCWSFTVPIVSPPNAVNGTATIVMKNSTQVTAGNFAANTNVAVSYNFLTRLADGYYLVMDGPYLGTATRVSLDGKSARFQTSGPFRLLIRLPEDSQPPQPLPYVDYTFDVAISTPYGSYVAPTLRINDYYRGAINQIPPGSPGSFTVPSITYASVADNAVGTYWGGERRGCKL